MGIAKYIWIKNKRYYLYDTYTSDKAAHKVARRMRKRNKCRYYIQKYEHGFLFPEVRRALYLDKCIRIW